MSGRIASAAERAEWVAAFVGGESQADIARRYGVSTATICHALQRHAPAAAADKRAMRRQTLALDERHMSRACREVFGPHAMAGGPADDSPRLLRQFALARCILLDLTPEDLVEAYRVAKVARRHELSARADMGCGT